MVSGSEEVEQVRTLIKREQQKLRSKAIPFGEPKIGAMIEVPSAVILIKEIAAVSDFLSLGTNDLIQYLLAVDRDNESVENWFRTLHPSVLRAIKHVADTARELRKPLIVCGEMAGSPYYLPLLLGLGVDELSMNVNSILRIRKMIAGIALEECRELANAAVGLATSFAVEAALLDHIRSKWSHLFPADFFSVKRI
jgi:phosphotransferase system enzyme I (PtsI)